MSRLCAVVVVALALAACEAEPVGGGADQEPVPFDVRGQSIYGHVRRYTDTATGVTCYVYSIGYQAGGISCLYLREDSSHAR